MVNKMWIGGPGNHYQWVPAPSIDSTIQRNRNVETIKFDNGGGDVRRSKAYQLQYDFNFSGPAHDVDGIDAFNRFASGYYGDGLMYVAHPATFETNMFGAQWASPALIREGWANIYTVAPSYVAIVSPGYNQPAYNATWQITTDAGVPTKKFTIPIPPTHTLHVGASGAATGAGVVRVRPIDTNGDYATPTDLTLLSGSGDTRMNATFAGSAYSAVEVYLTRTSPVSSTVTLQSMMAQLYKTGYTPSMPSNHYQGEGASGMEFTDNAFVETYAYMFPPHKGVSTSLVEVGQWR